MLEHLIIARSQLAMELNAAELSDEALVDFRKCRELMKRLKTIVPNAVTTEAVVASEIGQILAEKGQFEEALAEWRAAKSLFSSRRDQDVIDGRIATVLTEQGKYDEALCILERVLEWTEISDSGGLNTRAFPDQAFLHKAIGDVLARQKKPIEASEHYTVAVELAERLVVSDPRRRHYQRILDAARRSHQILLVELGNHHDDLVKKGDDLRAQGKIAEALTVYRQRFVAARELLDIASRFNGGTPDHKAAVAVAHLSIGNMLVELGKPADAVTEYTACHTIIQPLAEGYGQRKDYARICEASSDWRARLERGLSQTMRDDLNPLREAFRGQCGIARQHCEAGRSAAEMDALHLALEVGMKLRLIDASAIEEAVAHLLMGDALLNRGVLKASMEHFQVAQGIAKLVLVAFPDVKDSRAVLEGATRRLNALGVHQKSDEAETMPHNPAEPITSGHSGNPSDRRQLRWILAVIVLTLLAAGALFFVAPPV